MSGFENLIKTFFDVGDMMQVFPTLIGVGLRNTLMLAASARAEIIPRRRAIPPTENPRVERGPRRSRRGRRGGFDRSAA